MKLVSTSPVVGGTKMKLMLISTKVEVVVEVGVELGNIALKPPKHKVPYICAATSVRVLY